MEKQYAPSATQKKVNSAEQNEKKVAVKKAAAPQVAAPVKIEESKTESVKTEVKPEEKKTEATKKVAQKVVKKEFAIARGAGMPISKKHSMSICNMIKGKTPDKAIEMLEEVLLMKRAVPMNDREVPHRKGMMSGRYPLNSSRVFIDLLKQLKANSLVNGIDNPVIKIAKADKASRPYRRGGVRAKRVHIYLEAVEKTKLTTHNVSAPSSR